MGMLSMLGKVAMGVIAAKTIGKAMGGNSGGSGGLGGMLGGLLGGNKSANAPQSGGGIGDLLNSMKGNSSQSQGSGGGLGDLLSAALSGKEVNTTPSEEEKAKILLRAMVSAAKADGKIDKEEEAKITQHIGDVTPEELEIVKQEIESPVDLEGLIAKSKGIEQEVYLMSLLAINLDENSEAEYLSKLAKGLGITPEVANAIHQKVGAPTLYS